MPVFVVTAPDGNEYEITAPEGATEQQVLEYAKQNYSAASSTKAAPPVKDEVADETARLAARYPKEPSIVEKFFKSVTEKSMTPSYSGSKTSSYAEGMMDPIYGIGQLAVNAFGGGDQLNEELRLREQQIKAANEEAGRAGFDWMRMGGNIVSPINIPVTKGVSAATAGMPGLAQSATMGAAYGLTQPATGENFWTDKAFQAGVGAVAGPAVEYGLKAGGKVVDTILTSYTKKGQEKALVKYINELIGPDKEQAIKLLQDTQELVTGSRPTAAEVLADLPTAVDLVKKQAELARKQGLQGAFEQRAASQQAARLKALQRISGTEAQRTALKQTRDLTTGKTRELALEQADVYRKTGTRLTQEIAEKQQSYASALQGQGITATEAAQAANRANTWTPVPGYPRFPGRYSPNIERAAEFAGAAKDFGSIASQRKAELAFKELQYRSLEQAGFFPLKTAPVIDKIDKAIKSSSSDQSKQVLQFVRDKIIQKTDENGMIGSSDLYNNIRKTSNQDIARLLGLGDNYASGGIPEQAAKSLGNVKKFVDAALDESSQGLWSKYLKDYAKYSNKMNRMEVGQYLADKLNQPGLDKERIVQFANAVENAAGTIKKSTGIPRYEKLSDVLTPREVNVVNNVLADVNRASKAKIAGGAIEPGLRNLAGDVPPWFSAKIALFKEVLTKLHKGQTKQFNEKLSQLMLEPEKMATVLTQYDKQDIGILGKVLMEFADDTNKRAMIQLFTVPQLAQEAD